MPRRPRIPPELGDAPFSITDARGAGLERWHLEGAAWRRIAPRTYVAAGRAGDPLVMLKAAAEKLPQAIFSGWTAAWLHGWDVPWTRPIEMVIPGIGGGWTGGGLTVRRLLLPADDIAVARGFPASSHLRTLSDLSARLALTEAVVLADAMLYRRFVGVEELRRWVISHTGRKGVKRFRSVAELARPGVESPMETRVRMALVLSGLPEPEVQGVIRDTNGSVVARVDLLYREPRVVIEYDGETHRQRLAYDLQRQNRLIGLGYCVLRFTSADLQPTPAALVDRVRGALLRAA